MGSVGWNRLRRTSMEKVGDGPEEQGQVMPYICCILRSVMIVFIRTSLVARPSSQGVGAIGPGCSGNNPRTAIALLAESAMKLAATRNGGRV